ncbi:MAG: SAP domain-containing protein [Candidatus Methanoplasma sp.]|jgi:hypothetical protein|nr:SAP domain-containing protein [Candidatus Methanoplasma sp.]
MNRPFLDKTLNADIFLDHYFLKEELVSFCRSEGLPLSGGKPELTERAEMLEIQKGSSGKQQIRTFGSHCIEVTDITSS